LDNFHENFYGQFLLDLNILKFGFALRVPELWGVTFRGAFSLKLPAPSIAAKLSVGCKKSFGNARMVLKSRSYLSSITMTIIVRVGLCVPSWDEKVRSFLLMRRAFERWNL